MPQVEKYSATLEREMRTFAEGSERPAPRLETIDRLIAACDAIADGSGLDLIARQRGERPPRHGYTISPTNIEHYIRARASKSPDWTGPARGTIQKNEQFREYVAVRENERAKPKINQKPGPRAKSIDIVLQTVLPVENRQLLIEELLTGKRAIRELQLIKQGLSDIPGIDLDALLLGRKPDENSSMSGTLSKADRQVLRELVIRLTSNEKLSMFGLTLDRERIVQSGGLSATLVKPQENRLLM